MKRVERKTKLQNKNKNDAAKKKKEKQPRYDSDGSEDEDEENSQSDDGSSEEEEEDVVQTVQKSMKKGFAEKQKVKTPVDDSDESESDDEEFMKDDFDGESDQDDSDAPAPAKVKGKDILADSDDDEEGSDNSEEEPEDDDNSEQEDDSDSDVELPIEKANKKLKARKKVDDKLAEDELQLNIADKEILDLDDAMDVDKVISLQEIQLRIKDVAAVLMDFSANRDPTRSRNEYVEVLKKDLCAYYSYNEFLMETFMNVFAVNELLEFLESSEVQRPLTIRTNSLKTRRRDLAQALINRGVNLDPVGKWSKVGLVVYSSQVPLGATPEYLAGHYMIQGASSMLPVMSLAPQENERILDMCSAPGGKSSHIAAIMKNTGVLFANDLNRDRIHAVIGNFHRLGVVNSVVSCMNGIEYKKFMGGFDRVLLDAPCTGTGVISKDQSVKTSKSDVDVQRCYNLQRKLILSAIDCISAKSATGGYLVYSTCSILPEENEWVIDYALKKRNVRLVPTGLDFGVEGFTNYGSQRYHPSMKLTKRYYPHTHNMDGFFVAKLQKTSDDIPQNAGDEEDEPEVEAEEAAEENGEKTEAAKKTKVDKRDWFHKDLKEINKKPDVAEVKETYITKVFEQPIKKKFDKTKKKVNGIANGESKDEPAAKKLKIEEPASVPVKADKPAHNKKKAHEPAAAPTKVDKPAHKKKNQEPATAPKADKAAHKKKNEAPATTSPKAGKPAFKKKNDKTAAASPKQFANKKNQKPNQQKFNKNKK